MKECIEKLTVRQILVLIILYEADGEMTTREIDEVAVARFGARESGPHSHISVRGLVELGLLSAAVSPYPFDGTSIGVRSYFLTEKGRQQAKKLVTYLKNGYKHQLSGGNYEGKLERRI